MIEPAIPSVLKSLSSAGSAIRELANWRKRARGDARALAGELRDNLTFLDMVAEDGVPLDDVIGKISIAEYRRLSRAGYDFDGLKRGRIKKYASLKGSDLESWAGKRTEDLVDSIYDKINQLLLRYPHVSNHGRYRWYVRVNNIRKRVWLLLRHLKD